MIHWPMYFTIRYEQFNCLVIPQQSTSASEEARVGHQRNICW